ncbi:MAG: diguanylate cyclase, partial [Granulosicoccaceae bacterium]
MKSIRTLLSGLRSKVMLIVLACSLPLLVVSLYSLQELHTLATKKAERDAKRLATRLVRDEQRWMAGANQLLKTLAESSSIQKNDPGACNRFLADIQQHDPSHENLLVLNTNGQAECSAVPLVEQRNFIAESFYYRALKNKGFATGDFRLDPVTNKTVIDFAYANFASDHLKKVLVLTVSVDWFKELVDGEQIPKHASVVVLDPGYNVLYIHKELHDWLGKNVTDSAMARTLKANGPKTTGVLKGLDGKRRLYTFHTLNGKLGGHHDTSRMVLALGVPLNQAYEGVDEIVMRYLLVTSIALAALLLFGWLGSGLLLRKLDRLVEMTCNIAGGNYAARIEGLHGRDEVTRLAQSFNDMADTLQTQLLELERISRARKMLQMINRAIVHIQDEDELINTVCQIAIEQGFFQAAWIGSVNWEENLVQQRALIVVKPDSAEGTGGVRLDTHKLNPGIVQRVIESKHEIIVNDIKTSNVALPFRLHGNNEVKSAIALPLQLDGAVEDIVLFTAGETNAFNNQELEVMKEVAEDVSLGLAHIRLAKQVSYLSHHDPITGLFNRESYITRLQRAIEHAENTRHYVSVVALRIDNADQLSELYGIHALNRILLHIARSLMEILHENDVVASIGAYQFGIILPDLKKRQDAAYVAEKIRDNLSTMIHLGPDYISTTISAGFSLYPQDGATPDELMTNAELALTRNPDESKNSFEFYSPEYSSHVLERRKITQELSHALERKELRAVYQPVVDTREGCVVGVEALMRWESEALGNVMPSRFIPVAEHTGDIRFFGHWILTTACQQYEHWHNNGAPVHMAVNVSVKQLLDNDFTDAVIGLKAAISSETI